MSLQVTNLSVGYDRILIDRLNFKMNPGDRLIIYGSNGTGKSTLLHSLLNPRLEQKKSINWQIPADQIFFLNQQSSFHSQTPDDVESYLTHILLFKKPFTKPSTSHLEKIKETQRKLQLPNQPLKNLSGGQRQKLKIARALLLETKALLLDEPFNAIDQTSTHQIIDWLNDSRKNMIQIMVLHDLDQIEKLQSPILWIQENSWEILNFHDWFHKIDKRFHSWMHTVQKPTHTHAPIGSS